MTIDNLWVIGPGESVNLYPDGVKNLQPEEVLAFQNVFPNCYYMYSLVPSIWFCMDPNSFVEGFEFLNSLDPEEACRFKKMKIIVPHFSSTTYAEFRKYCGTTPLGRISGAWEKYIFLLESLKEKGYNIDIVKSTTTKYIKTVRTKENEIFNNHDIYDQDAYLRFMYHEPIFGTVEYDSESVIGDKYKWGLENKLSSSVFPLCFHLGAKNIYIIGFDLKGGRFYDISKTRLPWNDESQKGLVDNFPLQIIKKWNDWEPYHNMKFVSLVKEKHSLITKVIKYEDKLNE
jgi:hypothetical protein